MVTMVTIWPIPRVEIHCFIFDSKRTGVSAWIAGGRTGEIVTIVTIVTAGASCNRENHFFRVSGISNAKLNASRAKNTLDRLNPIFEQRSKIDPGFFTCCRKSGPVLDRRLR